MCSCRGNVICMLLATEGLNHCHPGVCYQNPLQRSTASTRSRGNSKLLCVHVLTLSSPDLSNDTTTTWGTPNNNITHKKQKKISLGKQAHTRALDPNDQAALNRRAARFQREHDIERQKQLHNSSSSLTFHPPSQYHHYQQNRLSTPGSFGSDDPEVDPVRACAGSHFC